MFQMRASLRLVRMIPAIQSFRRPLSVGGWIKNKVLGKEQEEQKEKEKEDLGGIGLARKLLSDPEMMSLLTELQGLMSKKGMDVSQLRKVEYQTLRDTFIQDPEFRDFAIRLQEKLAKLNMSPQDMIKLSKAFGTPLPPGFEEQMNQKN